MSEYVKIEGVRAIGQSDKALQVELPAGRYAWIPQSAIGPDSEVYAVHDHGVLQLARWKAVELGLAESDDPPRRPIPTKVGSTHSARITANMILTVMRGRASEIRDHALDDPRAICECGQCEGDPIAWHKAEILERVANEIEKVLKQ